MNKFIKIILLSIASCFLVNCSQVLQTVNLEINTEDTSIQEDFNVVEKTLTIKEAQNQKNSPYARKVLQNGRGGQARSIPESVALQSNFPKEPQTNIYKIGVGDTLSFSRLIENNRSAADVANQWPKKLVASKYKLGIGDTLALILVKDDNSLRNLAPFKPEKDSQNLIINSQASDPLINSKGRVGSDGSVFLLEIGRLEASGKSLNELRSEVRNILIRNGISPRFQLEIGEFKSQRAYLTVNSTSKVIVLDDQITTMRDILTSASVGFKPGLTTRIRLQRDGKEYIISLRDIYSKNAPEIGVRSGDHILVEDSSARIVTTASVVDGEGNVVFEGVGEIKAAGRSLYDLRTDIENLMQKVPDSQNAFQIEIKNFSSQTALVNVPGDAGGIITIKSAPLELGEVLTQNGLALDNSSITRIKLQRDGQSYAFPLDDLLNPNSPKVYLQSDDLITAEILPYKENKVFILGGVNPQIFKINPTNRETLADVLFTGGGVLSGSGAKRSEVYLLRGNNPVIAYHIDAKSPTRLIVAEAMELRPNDILYVAEQPIVSFNRTLTTIIPLRLLLRDIQEDNIP